MYKNFYITGTVTHAVKGRETLRKNGIKAYVERSFAADRIGCGYGIIAEGDQQEILAILRNADVKIKEVKGIDKIPH